MPYKYQPLQGDEIRLLTLEPNGDASSLISCTIENVRLNPDFRPDQSGCKGEDYIWPEIRSPLNSAPLFENSADPLVLEAEAQEKKLQASEEEDEGESSTNSKPFRYDWGDYVALSYVWGQAEGVQKRPILLNGEEFLVLPNLYDALLQLRRARRIRQQGFKVWADAICIDQESAAERGQQVGRMRDIFASAWHVVIYLGKEEHNSALAITALRWLAMRSRGPAPLEGLYREGKKNRTIGIQGVFEIWAKAKSVWKTEVYRALFHLLTRSYWQRTWILQEVAMARRDGPVICGDSCLSCQDVYDAAALIETDPNRLGRDIIGSVRPRTGQDWSYEFARDRIPEERVWSAERMWKLLVDLVSLQRDQRPGEASNHTSPPSSAAAAAAITTKNADTVGLMRAMILGRDSNVTKEHDRVYGILGLHAVDERVHVNPDYDLPLSAVYQDFTAQLLSKGNLDILRLVSRVSGSDNNVHSLNTLEDLAPGEQSFSSAYYKIIRNAITQPHATRPVGQPCTHNLPSWTVCWACRPTPAAQLRGDYRAGGEASPSTTAPAYGPDSTLVVRGIVFDTVRSLGSYHPREAGAKYPQTDNGDEKAVASASAYGSIEATQEALWRTVVGNTTARGGPPSASGRWLIDEPRSWLRQLGGVYTNGFSLAEQRDRNKTLPLAGGFTLDQIIVGTAEELSFRQKFKIKSGGDRGLYVPSEEQWEVFSWAVNALAWRRLMGTCGGRMGTAPAPARVGDRVAVLLGCSVPMVLRENGDGWVVVGECYVHGVMDGEVLAASSKEDVRDIKLY